MKRLRLLLPLIVMLYDEIYDRLFYIRYVQYLLVCLIACHPKKIQNEITNGCVCTDVSVYQPLDTKIELANIVFIYNLVTQASV